MIIRDKSGQVTFGKWELFFQAVILLSLLDFALGTLPNLSDSQRFIIDSFEVFSIAVFSIEYLIRATFSRPRRRYIFGFFGVVDLIAILPFFVGISLDLRSLRALRLLRLFRVLKLVRYSSAMKRIHRAFLISREELILFAMTAAILLYLAGVGIYFFEHKEQPEVFASAFDGLWWATATLTTVGYGDVYPVTGGGRFFTFLVLSIGLGIVAVPSGIVASALAQAREEEREDSSESDES